MEWNPLLVEHDVPAKAEPLWNVAIEYIEGPALLRVSAKDKWYYSENGLCGPDGDPASLLARSKVLFANGPVGALIGKIGGSSAGISDGAIFLAGSFCIFAVSKSTFGPLFLTINDEFGGMSNNRGSVKVDVALAPLTNDSFLNGEL